ncbi:MAG: methyltransferase domain-containing protein [Acidobacteria bacterium]|nr:methyltransferase domain-containing protein [Acidobacteriota bacterium]
MAPADFEKSHGIIAAENYERFFVPAIGRPVAEHLTEAARLEPGERALDVGCGTGIVARMAIEKVGPEGSVVGIDVNPAMLAVASTVVPEEAPVEWHQAPAESIPLGDDAFDVVLCQMSLQFFQDRVQAIREMRRVLTPEGRVLLSLPGPMTPLFGVLEQALGRHLEPPAAGFVRQVFSLHERNEIEKLLRDGGFDTMDIREEKIPLTMPPPAEFLDQYLASTPLSAVWASAEEPARAAVRREVVEGWQPFGGENGMGGQQPMTLAVAS